MSPLKILVVEDNLTIAQNLEEQLTDFGYQVIGSAATSKEVSTILETDTPDLVLLDVELKNSELDGIQVAEKMLTIPGIPFIYLTSFSDKKTKERAKKTRPANYLVKPYNEYQLEIAIDFALSNFSQQKEALFTNPSTPPKNNIFTLDEFFFTKKSQSYIRINFIDIVWLKAGGSAVEIVTEKDKVVSYSGIKGFIEQFQHPHIVRIHRSYAVNVLKISRFDENHVYLPYNEDTKAIPIGPMYRDGLLKLFKQLKSE